MDKEAILKLAAYYELRRSFRGHYDFTEKQLFEFLEQVAAPPVKQAEPTLWRITTPMSRHHWYTDDPKEVAHFRLPDQGHTIEAFAAASPVPPSEPTERVPNDDEVICPACTHQFRAIPVNVQVELNAIRAEPAPQAEAVSDAVQLYKDAREIFDYDGPETPQIVRDVIQWYHGSMLMLIARK